MENILKREEIMKIFRFLLGAGLLAMLFACNWEIPRSVTVKTSPTLRVPLGTRTNILNGIEGFDTNSMLDPYTDPGSDQYIEGLSLMDVPYGDPVTLLYNMDIIDVALDDFVTETFDPSRIQPEIDSVSFTVPEFNFPNQSIDLEPISADYLVFVPINVPGILEVNGTATLPPIAISFSAFSTVTFEEGNLVFDLSTANGTAGMEVAVNYASVSYGGPSDLVALETMPVPLDGSLSFDLSGITLSSNISLNLDVEIANGGGSAETFDLSVQPSFSSTTTISSASDITIDAVVDGIIDIPLDTPDEFVSAEIGTGDFSVNFNFPAAWNIQTYSLSLTLEQGDGAGGWTELSTVSDTDTTPVVFDLSGLTIDNNDMRMLYTATLLSAANSADFTTPANVGSVTGGISDFTILQIYSEAIDFSETVNEPIDTEINDMVAAVQFDSPVLILSVDNQLPISLQIVIASDALRVNNSFPSTSGSNETWPVFLLPAGGGDAEGELSIPETLTEIDFTVNVSSPNYDSGTNILTMNDVAPGAVYSMSGSASVDLELLSITIDKIDESFEYPDVGAGDPVLDLSAMLDIPIDGLSFSAITATLHNDIGSLPGDAFGIRVHTDDYNGDLEDDYLIGSALVPEYLDGTDIPVNGLSDIIEALPSDLRFYVSYNVTEVTIPTDGSGEHIWAEIEAVMPLQIEVTDPAGYEILDADLQPVIPELEEDLFGRTGGEDDETMNEILGMAESISLHADITNTTGMSAVLEISDTESAFETKTFALENGEQTITIDSDDLAIMINTFPFTPEFHILIPQGIHSFNQGSEANPADISVTAWLEIVTDVEYTVGGEEE